MMHLTSLSVYTAADGRRYIDSADIATICGLAPLALDNHYRPAAWAAPRDFRWDGRRMWYAILSLHELVDELFSVAKSDEAIRLREWSLAWQEAAIADQQKLFDAGTAQANSAAPGASVPTVASTPSGGGARVETPPPHNWAAEWEAARP